MSRYSRFAKPKHSYRCTVCGSSRRLFVQCEDCLLSFIHATDVAAKSSYYEWFHLWAQRPY